MILTEQCCLLPQSKRLQELGVTAKGLFEVNEYEKETTHVLAVDNDSPERLDAILGTYEPTTGYEPKFIAFGRFIGTYQAYTVAELLQALPCQIEVFDMESYSLMIMKNKSMYSLRYFYTDCPDTADYYDCVHEKQAPLLADGLIHLIENNLLTPSEVNEAINK